MLFMILEKSVFEEVENCHPKVSLQLYILFFLRFLENWKIWTDNMDLKLLLKNGTFDCYLTFIFWKHVWPGLNDTASWATPVLFYPLCCLILGGPSCLSSPWEGTGPAISMLDKTRINVIVYKIDTGESVCLDILEKWFPYLVDYNLAY